MMERLLTAAGPTQVRPLSFFGDPNLREFLLEPESLRRIREAAFLDNGILVKNREREVPTWEHGALRHWKAMRGWI